MRENVFIKLPNYMVKAAKDENGGLVKEADNKLLLVVSYLYLKRDLLGISSITLEDLILSCGYKPKKGKGANNENFKNILLDLKVRGLISGLEEDFKPKDLLKIELNIFKKGKEGNDINFFIVDYEKFKEIVSLETKIDKAILYNLYCYIKSCIKNIDKNIDQVIHGGNYPVAYPSYQAMCKNIGINQGTIKSYLNELVDMKYILFENAGKYSPAGNKLVVYESNNTYICYENDSSEEILQDAIKFYKKRMINDGYIFKKNYKVDNRVVGGKITGLKNKIKAGKATNKDKDKLLELEAIVGTTPKTKEEVLINILENKRVISEFYEERNHDEYEKYRDIELSLELINEDDELIVEYKDYYKAIKEYLNNENKPEEKVEEKIINIEEAKIEKDLDSKEVLLKDIIKLKNQIEKITKKSFELNDVGVYEKKSFSKYTRLELNEMRYKMTNKIDRLTEDLWFEVVDF